MNDIIYATKTWTSAPFREPGRRNPLTTKVTARLYSLGGRQLPYFSLTGETRDNRGKGISFGAVKGKEAGPFAPYERWHLTSTDGPLHYLANALYWAGLRADGSVAAKREPSYAGDRTPPNWEFFANTIVLGAVEGDPEVGDFARLPGQSLVRVLTERHPKVVEAFKRDMLALFDDQTEGVERAFAHKDPRKEVA